MERALQLAKAAPRQLKPPPNRSAARLVAYQRVRVDHSTGYQIGDLVKVKYRDGKTRKDIEHEAKIVGILAQLRLGGT